MTSPDNPYTPLITAIETMNENTHDQTTALGTLSSAVLSEAAARDKKVATIQRLTTIMILGIVMLIGLALTNYVLISRASASAKSTAKTATATQQTNALLLSCFDPNSPCSKQAAAGQAALNTQIRQTTFVLFVCSRLNPADPNNPDPEGNTARLVKCVQGYYPDFKLPSKTK